MSGPISFGYQNLGFGAGGADPGKLILIQTQTPSGVTTVDFTSIQEDVYKVHFVTWSL